MLGTLAAALALFLVADAAQARPARGGRGGSHPAFHGAYHTASRGGAGGSRGGYSRGNGGRAYYGGYRGGYYNRGYSGYGRGYYGRGGWYGWPGVGLYVGGPYYGGYGYPYSYGSSYTYAPTYTAPYYPPVEAGGIAPSSYESSYTPSMETNVAQVRVFVPRPDTQVWMQGERMQPTGTERWFASPPLQPGKTYTYTIRASWIANGKQVNRTKEVTVQAGQEATVRF
jgi:uncharacterized protein (TIGR03000 family)